MAVLHGASWLDVTQLGAIVATNRLRQSALRDDFIQHAGDAPAGEARVHFQALAGERIRDAQHTDGAAGSDEIMCEVQRPLLVCCCQHSSRRTAANAVFTLLPLLA